MTDIRTTTEREGERGVALSAINDGCTTIVAAGGDGTWGNVANAILNAGAADRVRLGMLAAGTGNDFAKTVGAPANDLELTVSLALNGGYRRVDVGRIEDQYFLNVTGFGFDIAVLEDISSIKWLRGSVVYVYSALRQLVGYPGIDIDISSEAGTRGSIRHLMLVISNARYFGGAFEIAPGAKVDDGKLDAISIHDASAIRRLRLLGSATRGTHVDEPEVTVEQAGEFRLRFASAPSYETDGEYRRARSAELTVTCLPGALRVVVPT